MNASMDVENEKILKEFMDVLDDEEEEEVYMPKNAVIISQTKTINSQYHYDVREV